MARKPSSPITPTFMVSAPGKVLVFGEHAAVYGKPAIAAAISLRSYLLVSTLSISQRTVQLNFRDIGLNHTWVFHHPSKTVFRNGTDGKTGGEIDQEMFENADGGLRHRSAGRSRRAKIS